MTVLRILGYSQVVAYFAIFGSTATRVARGIAVLYLNDTTPSCCFLIAP